MVALLFLLSLACTDKNIITEEVQYAESDLQVEVLRDVDIFYSDSAKIQVNIKAPKMLRHTDRSGKQEFPDGLLVIFFNNNQQMSGELTAKHGMLADGDADIVVRDSVVWKTPQGEQLDTEELTLDRKNGKIFTNKFVTLTKADEIIFGYGFEADQDFKRSSIKAVDGRIKLNELAPEE